MDLIESYDVIVRLNVSCPVPQSLWDCSGISTDVLYNCLNGECIPEGGFFETPDYEKNLKFLVCPLDNISPFNSDIKRFMSENNHRIPFCWVEEYKDMVRGMGTRPNTGTTAMIHLLSKPIRELYVTGVSFCRGGYVKEYREGPAVSGSHNFEKQIRYFRREHWGDKRLTTDQAFSDIMNEGH